MKNSRLDELFVGFWVYATFNMVGRKFLIQILSGKMPNEYYLKAAIKQALWIHMTCPPICYILIITTRGAQIECSYFGLIKCTDSMEASLLGQHISTCKSFPNVFPPSTTEAIIYITLFPFNGVRNRLNWHMYYVLDWSFLVIQEISHHGWIIQKSPMKPNKLLFSISSVWKFMGYQPKTCLAKKLDGFHVLVYNQMEWPFAKMHSCSRHEFRAVEL